jgi:hypothetical protein
MTTGHVNDHNTLRTDLLAEAARLGVSISIGGPFAMGDPAHIHEHNRLVTGMQAIADAQFLTLTLPDTATLGDTGHIDDHDLLAAALADIQAAPGFNTATGGTVTEFVSTGQAGTVVGHKYRVHAFLTVGSETLTVAIAINPFDYVLVGAGGGGANYSDPGNGASGAGGIVVQDSIDLAVTAYSIGIGAAGSGGDVPTGTAGSASTALSLTAAGGNPGGWGVDGTGGSNLSLDFDGTGAQGYGMDAPHASYTVAGKYGGGGGGGSAAGLWGFSGMTGAFLIRYEIAP